MPSFATEQVDVNGIPKVYYAPQNNIAAGTQYNATIVANYAINYYEEYKKNIVDEFSRVNGIINASLISYQNDFGE